MLEGKVEVIVEVFRSREGCSLLYSCYNCRKDASSLGGGMLKSMHDISPDLSFGRVELIFPSDNFTLAILRPSGLSKQGCVCGFPFRVTTCKP